MTKEQGPILVFGATGQQGGSVATALLKAGRQIRALVRDPTSPKSAQLREAGVDLVKGNLDDIESMRAAMAGVHGVFSVQPSSGQGALYGVTDDDEVRYGTAIADAAVEAGVGHLVYSSVSAAGDQPVGIGYFDSKGRIESHIRSLPIAATIVRPVGFMDMLVRPGFGHDTGHFVSFAEPEQSVQVIAVEDIGKFVAAIFADRTRFDGVTLEIASDMFVARDIATFFTEAAGRPISYSRFPEQVLAANPFLARMADLMNGGPLAGRADMDALRAINPEMQSFRSWLAGSGRAAFQRALGAAGA
ncbi:MAG: NmrA/HSCARG family protein [Caulobacteraceae bacterium]